MSADLRDIVDGFSKLRILILGDYLLDEYVFGEISRVSREAPVLILSYQQTDFTPGGAANTVAGVDSLSATAIPVGFRGTDKEADKLISCWPPSVVCRHLLPREGFKTTRKTRILAGSTHSLRQQVVRMDYEYAFQLREEEEERVSAILEELIPAVDGVVLSDYSLGNVTLSLAEIAIKLARRFQKPVVADSRFNPAGFRRATSVTPNISEIEESVGDKIGANLELLERIGTRLRLEWELEALLITRGKHGMSLFEEREITHIPIYGTDQVVDVTGAGDTVIATYTTALAAGADFKQAARLANYAGGIVVSKRGTATVSVTELRDALDHDDR